MALQYPIQANFTRGELNPRLHGRVDIEHYKAALKTCTNWTILKQGGLRRRTGTLMIKEVKDSTKKTRVVPFIFGTPSNGVPQAYALEFGNLYMRVYANGGLVTNTGLVPTAITKANPAVVTIAGHGFANGDKVYVTGVGGMTQLNNREYLVAGVTANTFQLSGVNSTGYTTFTAGGSVAKIVEIVTPYLEADLPLLDTTQSADTLTVTHIGYQPQEITRTSNTAWTIAPIVFKDGPYLDEPAGALVSVTPSISNAIHPLMTSNTAPSGIVASNTGGAGAFNVFSRSSAYFSDGSNSGGGISFDAGSPVVVDNYTIQAPYKTTGQMAGAFYFQAWDGSQWITLDTQDNQKSWGTSEVRCFKIVNSTAYTKYKIEWAGTIDDTTSTVLGELNFGYNGDYAPTMTLNFGGTANINNGAGFTSNDIARNIRLLGKDGMWRYFVITSVSSTTVVSGRMYGYAFPDTSKIVRWKLGAFYSGNWPAKCGFYQSRRVFARSSAEPYNVWLTKSFDFYDMGTSDPLVDDDAMRIRMLTGRVNGVRWLADSDFLAIGTTDNIRILDRGNKNAGFGATNFDHQTRSNAGCAELDPVTIQNVILFADFYGKTIREFIYDLNSDGYIAADITKFSDHLLASGIVAMAYQKVPDSIIWIVTAAGGLVSMTYDREEKIVGLTNCPIAGGDTGTAAVVESVCSIPGSTRDEVYMIVKRTIGGVTKRYIERLAMEFENMPLAQAVYLDSALTYSGAATGTVTGLSHLAGQTVNALADGVVFKGLVVSGGGSVTLPNSATASTITVGLGYTSFAETLALAALSQDGVHLGRRAQSQELYFSVMESLGLKIKGQTSIDAYDVFNRDTTIDPISGAMVLRNGTFVARPDSSWRENGQFQFYVDDPLPCTVRAVVIGATGEP